MAKGEKITDLLVEIKKLEEIVSGVRDAEIYPISFFSQTFDLTRKILTDLHTIETEQIEVLKRQVEEHQALIQAIPRSTPIPQPAPEPQVKQTNPEPITEVAPIKEEMEIRPEVEKEEQPEIIPLPKLPQPEVVPEIIVTETDNTPTASEKTVVSLNEVLAKKSLSDFRKAFSLNDRFYFRRELFGNDEGKMNKTISVLNDLHSYEESVEYIKTRLGWDPETPCVSDFIKLIEKRFL